jgi:3-dehydroquinate synthetase
MYEEQCADYLSFSIAIMDVLQVEVPNAREQDLDRVMFFGHTWSPMLELEADPPLLHGHAIAIDMCFSVSLALLIGKIRDDAAQTFLNLFSNLGLALDHPSFTASLLHRATASTTATRNGQLRSPIPTEKLGTYEILANVPKETLLQAWAAHKTRVKSFPRKGLGIDPIISIRV